MHYARQYRLGSLELAPRDSLTLSSHGYLWAYRPKHPLASNAGVVYQHRHVLFDLIGPGAHPCHWCGCEVEWKGAGKRRLCVDHLDGDKTRNEADNLVPACHRCNSTRGLFEKWVREHRDDPFLLRLFDQARRT